MKKKLSHKYGYTMMEVLITIIIISALASLAIPNLYSVIERTRSSEGVEILTTLLHQQQVYRYETGNGVNYATALTQLGVSFTTIDNFNQPTVANNAAALATIQRDTGDYRLSINSQGTISCTNLSGTYCSKFGY